MPGDFLPLSRLLSTGRPDGLTVCHDAARPVSWREFVLRTGGIARALSRCEPMRWLIHCDHPLDFAAALLACLHAGARAVLPPGFQAGTLAALRPGYDGVLGSGPTATVDLARLAPAQWTFAPLPEGAGAIDLYTSGSSGEPKRVEKSLAQLDTETRALETCWGPALGNATMVGTVPHHHIYGMLFRVVWPLSAGRPFDAVLCADPETLLERLGFAATAALVSGPAHLARLAELIDLAALAPRTACVFSSGGPLAPEVARELMNRLGRAPVEVYGSTETGGVGWRRQEGQANASAWTPFPGMEVKVGPGGALTLRSPYVPLAGWLALDDGARMLGDGRFMLTGRLDRVAKIEGKRVALPELERRLREHPWVADAGVVQLPGRRQTLGAAIVLAPSGRLRLDRDGRYPVTRALREYLGGWFEPVVLPRHWRFPARLPVNDRGKLAAADLARLFRATRDAAPVA